MSIAITFPATDCNVKIGGRTSHPTLITAPSITINVLYAVNVVFIEIKVPEDYIFHYLQKCTDFNHAPAPLNY